MTRIELSDYGNSPFEKLIGHNKIVLDKFIEVDEGFYNARLMKEMVKREKKSTNLSANAKKRWMQNESKSNANAYTDLMQLHKPIEIENENIVITKELYEKICENILDQKEFWLMIFKATKIPAERAQELFKTFSYEQGCIEYRTATELKKHFTNWIKIESKKDNHEQPQKFNGKF